MENRKRLEQRVEVWTPAPAALSHTTAGDSDGTAQVLLHREA